MQIISKSADSNIITCRIQEKQFSNNSQLPKLDNPIDFTKNLPKIIIPAHMTVDTTKYRESLVTDKFEIESVLPKIK